MITEIDIDDSSWEDFNLEQQHVGTVTDIKKVVTHLRQAFPSDEIEINVGFQTMSMLQKFQKKLQEEYQIFNPKQRHRQENDAYVLWSNIFRKNLNKLDKCKQCHKSYKIIFHNPLDLTIFYLHYQRELNKLEKLYKYSIIPYRRKFVVYLHDNSQDNISSFFKSELIQMRKKLITSIEENQQVYMKVKYSKLAVQKLQKKGIKTILVPKYQAAAFYSDQYPNTYQIRSEVNRVLSYHISVIKFPQKYVDQYILKEMMKLVYFQIKPTIHEIEKFCQMPVQVNMQKAAISITDYHQVFTDGLIMIQSALSTLKILQIQCISLVNLKLILLKPQYSFLAKFSYNYRRFFIIFNDQVIKKHLKAVQDLCSQIAMHFRSNYRLVAHFAHLNETPQNLRSQMKRSYRIAAKYSLECMTFTKFMTSSDYNKLILEPKQLGLYGEYYRERQIRGFLTDFLTNKTYPELQQGQYEYFEYRQQKYNPDESYLIYETQEKSDNQTQKVQGKTVNKNEQLDNTLNEFQQNLTKSKSNKSISSSSSQNEEKVNQSSTNQKSNKVHNILMSIFKFQYPDTEPMQQSQYLKRGKRQIALQQKIEKELSRQVRISKIILNQAIQMPQFKTYQKVQFVIPRMFTFENQKQCVKKYSEVDTKKFMKFRHGDKGYLSFINKDLNAFVPVYEVQFLDQ